VGISKAVYALLLKEKKRRGFQGRVLQLGRQPIYLTYQDVCSLAQRSKVPLHTPPDIALSQDPSLAALEHIDDATLLQSLGFTEVESLDISNESLPTHHVDLNHRLPANLEGRYDLVYDGGVLDEARHLPQTLENIHRLLKPEGIVIHFSPFKPFFEEYYVANRYANLAHASHEEVSLFVAQKSTDSTFGQIPDEHVSFSSSVPNRKYAKAPSRASKWRRRQK